MQRIKRLVTGDQRPAPSGAHYQPLASDADAAAAAAPFSWAEYAIFVLLGVSMLWSWNMFIAAAPYFHSRFAADAVLANIFQSAILSVFTATNLSVILLLQHMQRSASYPLRVTVALVLSTLAFGLLAGSTFLHADGAGAADPSGPRVYFFFLLFVSACTAWACGLNQNGVLALASGWGRPEYMQAVLVGQAVAGVLPSAAQALLAVFVAPHPPADPDQGDGADDVSPMSAFVFFLTAIAISLSALFAFAPLLRRNLRLVARRGRAPSTVSAAVTTAATTTGAPVPIPIPITITDTDGENRNYNPAASTSSSSAPAESQHLLPTVGADKSAHPRPYVGMATLLSKLRWHAAAMVSCFAVTLFYPAFSIKVTSVADGPDAPAILHRAAFVPLACLVWNLGDLAGRVSVSLPNPLRGVFSLHHDPRALFVFSLARLGFIPLYLLCNINGRGPVVGGDGFYLFVVQLGFGLTNGWLGTMCMLTAAEHVEPEEREVTGGFMGICLVVGLTLGSILSFSVANI